MRTTVATLVTAACLLAAAVLDAAPQVQPAELPATVEPVTGSLIGAYILFSVAALLTVMLVYRGVRAS